MGRSLLRKEKAICSCCILGLMSVLFLKYPGPGLSAARNDLKLVPPPAELVFKGGENYSTQIASKSIHYGKATVRESWQAKRVDYRWEEVKKKYLDFHQWYNETKTRLEQTFASTAWGMAKVTAARDLFDFALEADKRKQQLESENIYSGKWKGRASVEVHAPFLGDIQGRTSLKMSFTTQMISKEAQEPLLIITGDVQNGIWNVKGDIPNLATKIEAQMRFQGDLTGRFDGTRNSIVCDVTPKHITGSSKSSMTTLLGELSVIELYGHGVMKTKGAWPEMTALAQYVKVLSGDLSPPPNLGFTKSIAEKEILAPFQLDGSLNWIPRKLPEIRHRYFQQWFDTFWKVLTDKIKTAEDLKSKANTAKDLYERYVKKALADGKEHKIREEVINHCRLWAARPGSSLDDSFQMYFHWMDAFYQDQVVSEPDLYAKRKKSKAKFDFSVSVTQDFQFGYLSQSLQNKLHLWMNRERSYIDACFDLYLGCHNKYWNSQISQAPSFASKDSLCGDYFKEVIKIIRFVQFGVLSGDIVNYYGLTAGRFDGYGDHCFQVGWDIGRAHFEPQLPPPGTMSSAVRAYEKWLIKEVVYAQWGIASNKVAIQVENQWNKLLQDYPLLQKKYNK